jgi:folate-dependent phosphoribosylglycinamide formyltransferase PurN
MISGGGRTLLNLLDKIDAGELAATVPLVIASRPCAGVERARGRVAEVIVMPGRIPAGELEQVLSSRRIDWVVLAGYLQLVNIPPAYRGRVVNIHPALLPKHGGPGMHGHHVHEAVLAAGEAESGCTVHFADDSFDTGAVILQKRCPVLAGDTPETLAARVFGLELEALPEAMKVLLAHGGAK